MTNATRLRPDDEVAWYRLAQADRASGDRQGQETAMAEFKKLHNPASPALKKQAAKQDITPQELGAVPEQP